MKIYNYTHNKLAAVLPHTEIRGASGPTPPKQCRCLLLLRRMVYRPLVWVLRKAYERVPHRQCRGWCVKRLTAIFSGIPETCMRTSCAVAVSWVFFDSITGLTIALA